MSGPSSGPTMLSSTDSHPSTLSPPTLNSSFPSQHFGSMSYGSSGVSGSAQGEAGSKRDSRTMHSANDDQEESRLGGNLRKRDRNGSYRRHLPRSSGGFLLEPAFATTAHTQNLQSRSQESETPQTIPKDSGKVMTRADLVEVRGHKQHHRHRRHHTSSSLGNSPLSKEVTTAKRQYSESETPNNLDGTLRPGSNEDRASTVVAATNRPMEGDLPGQGKTTSNQQQNTVGLDTDPLHIVNIALNLSESRRKGVTTTRFNTSNIPHTRRAVSAVGPGLQEVPSHGLSVGGSLKQHLQQQRRISRNVSPTPDRSAHVATPPNLQKRKSGSALQATASLRQDQEYTYSFSKSTLARAEKAKISLELSAEYIRLLQFLPPLNSFGNPYSTAPNSPIMNESRNQLSRVASGSSTPAVVGRPYNPLQCIRNRKVRARERRSIDPVAEGWTDLVDVRNWVNMVESESSSPSFQSGDRVVLPQFSGSQESATVPQSSSQTGRPDRSSIIGAKPKRPRVDWQVSPAELLADAFWLELGDNKRVIEDSHGNKIYGYDSNLVRHNSTIEHEHTGGDSVIGSHGTRDGDREDHPSGSIRMPSFTAQLEHDRDAGSERGRRRRKIHKFYRHHDDGARPGRRSIGWRRDDAPLNDSSGASSDAESSRGRRRGRDSDIGDITGSQVVEELRREAGDNEWASLSSFDTHKLTKAGDILDTASGNASTGQGGLSGFSKPLKARPIATSRSQDSLQRSRSASVSITQGNSPNDSLDKQDSVPGIAIDLSPPQSRTTSPVRNSIVKAGAKIGLFRTERGKERENVENDPVRNDSSERHHGRISIDTDHQAGGERREPSPTKRPFPRTTGETIGKEVQQPNSKLSRDDRDEREPESSRRLGNFKGGRKARRIEEIVRSEVSKVGDLIRRKEGPAGNSVLSFSATSSYGSSSESDGNSSTHGTKKRYAARQSPSNSDDEGRLMAVKEDRLRLPEYRSANLPAFTSPPSRRGRIRVNTETSPEADHITLQQVARGEHAIPSRFLRYAPPKIDTDSLPELSRQTTRDSDITRPMDTMDYLDADSRRNSYGSGGVLGNSAIVHDPNGRFSSPLGMPSGSKLGPFVTGLTALDPSSHRRSARRPPSSSGQQQTSISDQGVSAARDYRITRREIARLRVLWLSSGVKAQQISNRANEAREPSPALVPKKSDLVIPRVPRSEEHILAAQIHSSDMQQTSHIFNEAASRFKRITVNNLHNQITTIREHISSRLSPLVRGADDDAVTFSTELSTTHTLAVKQLNDSVDKMIRRRKRRLRIIRRFGYALLEWTLLGVMWWVWLVVVIIRMVRITVGGFVQGVRWLLWL
ncbi:MAG: hypothetical protein M1813_002245 [Trichoglossum hirsutum]|nr:MAG: hypothetical protein M1813_002245 [Trichoglossum hirsutum]